MSLPFSAANFLQEMVDQGRDVFFSLPQGRHCHRHHIEAVKEILPEGALLHPFFQVPVGGADDPHIGVDGLIAAQPLKLPFLEKTQELDLEGRGKLADLVEKEGAAVGLFEPADPALAGAR